MPAEDAAEEAATAAEVVAAETAEESVPFPGLLGLGLIEARYTHQQLIRISQHSRTYLARASLKRLGDLLGVRLQARHSRVYLARASLKPRALASS
jgi:hypothetical protein